MISIPKGTKDVLPGDSYKWQYVEKKFKESCDKFGFKEIRTPVIEHTELFARGIGDTTDVVQKEMYTFEIAERSLTLKPEGTAGVVRSFIENKLYADTMPAKYFYVTPCYRYEKMQKGRQREFHQFGIETFGSNSMLADVETIALAIGFLEGLGIDDLQLRINSIGCPDCRGAYRKALQEFLKPHFDELCETCKGRFDRNPMRILDCKSPECNRIAEGAPKMLNFLCDDCKAAFEELKSYLDAMEISYVVDPDIVRGLDYYTKTAFEIKSDKLGAQSTVCGGGRYDNLIAEVGGPATPGVGFGLGIERLLLVMEAAGIEIPKEETADVFIACLGSRAKAAGLRVAKDLRAKGFKTCIDVMDRGLKAQLKYSDRLGASYSVVIGDDELDKGVVTLRDMKNSSQKEVKIEDLGKEII